MAEATLKDRVHGQMVTAMKAGDKGRTQVLRMVLSEIKAQEADKPEADHLIAAQGYAKKLQKSVVEMERLNQPERVAQIKSELAIVEEFLPKQIEDGELESLVAETLAGMGVVTAKESGKAIGAVMKAVAAKGVSADAAKVRGLIGQKISS